MGNKISVHIAENGLGRAEVYNGQDAHYIKYYDQNGVHFHTEHFPDKSIHFVEDAAYNWSVGVKVLHG